MMDNKKIAEFIRNKRKEKKMTQLELADKLYVTEKAISRWETGRGTPDVSLLLPLSEILDVSVSDILNGEIKTKSNDEVKDIIKYVEINRKGRFNIPLLLLVLCYIVSIFIFLFYLKFDYTNYDSWGLSSYEYIIRLLMVVGSSIFILIGNFIFSNNYVDKISDKEKVKNLSNIIIFIYYCILLFNLGIFARKGYIDGINLIPFKTIYGMFFYQDADMVLINVIGNLVVFMPIEYFLIELFKINKFRKNIKVSFFIIFIFELIQLIFKAGVFDVDDIILCLLGMMIFYFLYNKFKSFKRKKLWIVFIVSFIVFAFFSYNYLNCYANVSFKYDKDRMSCVVEEDKIIYNLFGTNLTSTKYTYRKVDNRVFVFINDEINIMRLLEEKQQYKDSLKYKEENKTSNIQLYGSKLHIYFNDKFMFDSDDIIEVYYTDISFDRIDKTIDEKISEVVYDSIYMCSNQKAKN